jgi:hypothetical protein
LFMKWNGARFATAEEARAKGPAYRQAVLLPREGTFASEVGNPSDARQVYSPVDLRLQARSKAIDAGQLLPGMNDGFAGAGPDLGAHELGEALPHYGPRQKSIH